VGTFRNTYYDFPAERDYAGGSVPLFDAGCRELARVPRGFHDAVCVQGSGLLSSGRTVSFARRHCTCAAVCPRTDQHICFDALDAKRYPFGRGAMGHAVVPLLTVAVDSAVIPLGTSLFIPEYVGLPRGPAEPSGHDGCFIAQDRGIKVRGQHVDIFTGEERLTRLWNRLVPSNRGVTVIVDSPACARAE
jgi:3D (Asp-Asp-Asp) domain-containing protein